MTPASATAGYEVSLRRSAARDIYGLPLDVRVRVLDAIQGLSQAPRAGAEKVKCDTGSWRVRIGDYRILYRIDDERDHVVVNNVRRRDKAYG